MPAKILIVFAMLFFSLVAVAQQEKPKTGKDLLMLFPANPLPETQMMTPFVKKLLENMNDGKNKGIRLFRSVSSSADYSKILSAEEMLMSNKRLLGETHDMEKLQTPERKKRDSLYGKLLNNFDKVLLIELIYRNETNTTLIPPDHYLYYFTLQNIVNIPGNLPLADETNSVSLLVKAGTDIRKVLVRKLRELFPESNEPPVIRISSSLAAYKGGYYCTPGDSVKLAFCISDADSDPYLFRYSWKFKGRQGVLPDYVDSFDSTLTLVVHDTGTIFMLAQVHDEFSPSNVDTFRLHVIPKPQINLIRNCYYVHIGKKNGVLSHPFDALFQPYLFFDTTKTHLFNITEIYTEHPPSAEAAFRISPLPSQGRVADSVAASEFRIDRNKSYLNLRHSPYRGKPGVYSYQITLFEHGIASNTMTLRLRYRKASAVYSQFGFIIGKFKADEKMYLGFTTTAGAFLHRYLSIEFSAEFPMVDSLFGRGTNLRYANHRISALTPIPVKAGLIISPEIGFWIFRYPTVSTDFYDGVSFGINVKMLYTVFPWIGTCYRFGYTETRQLPGRPVKNGFFYMAIGISIQPISKKGKH